MRDALDFGRLREHVEGLRGHQPVAFVAAESSDIACQGTGVARDVTDDPWGEGLQGLQCLGMATGTRWINYQPIDLCCQLRQEVFYLAFQYFHVTGLPQILLRILDGAGRFFDGNHFPVAGRHNKVRPLRDHPGWIACL